MLAATTGYQTRAFGESADRLGVELVFATDRCDVLDDPWRDAALPIRFHTHAESVDAILAAAATRPIDAVLAVGDPPTVIAARVSEALGLAGHPPAAAEAARHKLSTRQCLRAASLPTPMFAQFPLTADPDAIARAVGFPAVVKPLTLSGSRGVMRVDDEAGLARAIARLRALLASADIREEQSPAHDLMLVERFIPGQEFAVEGLMNHGELDVLAIFDKPDPLDGPFFEETIYLTPSAAPLDTQRAIVDTIGRAAAALGLRHGPVHAECRVNQTGVYVLEVAARPIGGLCARALRFVPRSSDTSSEDASSTIPLEELLLRHALGESSSGYRRERWAAGVMMIPIPRRGVLRAVSGIDDARNVPGIDEIRITAKPDQLLMPLPEGASYLGFIFARSAEAVDVERALRAAHERLVFSIAPEVRVLQSKHG